MPHITFPLDDLRALSGREALTLAEVDEATWLVKGELKLRHSSDEEVKVELQDTNRPDTWCVEGIARHMRMRRSGKAESYPFFAEGLVAEQAIEVDPSVEGVRPFVAGFLATGYAVDDAGLKAFISAQEVLCRNFGRKRKGVAIGIYDASAMQFPVRYEVVDAAGEARAFVPLAPAVPAEARDGAGEPIPPAAWEEAWTPARILRDHPTGREYAAALSDPARAPILTDASGAVLSFPPIINSASLGRVVEGMDQLFVEVTGTVLDQVLLALNVLAANLADRGARIEPVVSRYPFDTPRGREVLGPHPLSDRRTVDVAPGEFARLLGEPGLNADAIRPELEAFGLQVESAGESLRITAPPYRCDYLHPVDAIEDFAIARGFAALEPRMPEEFTVGHVASATDFADLIRDLAIGCGFEETISNILSAEELLRERMAVGEESGFPPLHGGPLVRIENVMNRNYAVLRDWLIPTLMQIEASSSSALFPHRFFEVGEVCCWEPGANLKTRTELRLGALCADHAVGFSETQAYLHVILANLGIAYAAADGAGEGPSYGLEVVEHPSFIPGRAARILLRSDGRSEGIGILGEVHPEVLTRWGMHFPVAAFELQLEPLRRLEG